MKKLVIILTSTFTSFYSATGAQTAPQSEFGPETLIKATYISGFEINPKRRTFTFKVDGKMSLEVSDLRDGAGPSTKKNLGQLSADAVAKLKNDIDSIPASAKLTNSHMGGPVCTDTPSVSVSVQTHQRVMEVYRRANCHQWDLDSREGKFAAEFGAIFLKFD